jgi:hypothetical protein
MDLGVTALGNWKAQQGGCTHIQVGPLRRCSTAVGAHPTPLFSQFFNEINDLKCVSFLRPYLGTAELKKTC